MTIPQNGFHYEAAANPRPPHVLPRGIVNWIQNHTTLAVISCVALGILSAGLAGGAYYLLAPAMIYGWAGGTWTWVIVPSALSFSTFIYSTLLKLGSAASATAVALTIYEIVQVYSTRRRQG